MADLKDLMSPGAALPHLTSRIVLSTHSRPHRAGTCRCYCALFTLAVPDAARHSFMLARPCSGLFSTGEKHGPDTHAFLQLRCTTTTGAGMTETSSKGNVQLLSIWCSMGAGSVDDDDSHAIPPKRIRWCLAPSASSRCKSRTHHTTQRWPTPFRREHSQRDSDGSQCK